MGRKTEEQEKTGMSFAQPVLKRNLHMLKHCDEAKNKTLPRNPTGARKPQSQASPPSTNLALFLARKLARMYSRPEKDRNVFRGFYDLENGGRILEQH